MIMENLTELGILHRNFLLRHLQEIADSKRNYSGTKKIPSAENLENKAKNEKKVKFSIL